MHIQIGTSSELIEKAQSIRHQVFVIEQAIPQSLDLDGLDHSAHHIVITDDDTLVATARLLLDEYNNAVLARIAVMKPYRDKGIASTLIHAIVEHAEKLQAVGIDIHAHEYLRHYYEKFGFNFIKHVEKVGEHQLIAMHNPLSG